MIGREICNIRINMSVQTLIEILKKNLVDHKKDHAKAMVGWNKKMAKLAEKLVQQAKAGKVKEPPQDLANVIHNPPPEYSETYQAAIELFGHHEGTEVTLSSKDYDQLVRNNWDWTHEFRHTNSLYGVGRK